MSPPRQQKTDPNKPLKCSQAVRKIPLEQFRLSTDSVKWRQAARNRQNLLIRISSYANGDGSFDGGNGKNYSPSEKTITKHVDPRTYYRISRDLQKLGWLSWTREQNHYGRRLFVIHLDNEVPPTSPAPTPKEHVPDSQNNTCQMTGDNTCQMGGDKHLSPWQVITPVTVPTIRLIPNTRPKNAEFSGNVPMNIAPTSQPESARDDSNSAIDYPQSHDITASIEPSSTPIASISRATASTHPSNPREGRSDASANEDEGGVEADDLSVLDVEPSPAEMVREQQRQTKQDRQNYAVCKSIEWGDQPKAVQDRVMSVVKQYEREWEFWATHNADGDELSSRRGSDDTEDEAVGSFPAPSKDYKLRLAQKLQKYTDAQAIRTWIKFLRRPQGFGGLTDATPWTLFLGASDEFEVRVESEEDSSKAIHQQPLRQQPPLAAFVAAFKAERVSDGWIAKCPLHQDSNPSMLISQTEDGKVIVHCRAGCNQTKLWSTAVEEARRIPVDELPPLDDAPRIRTPKEFTATSDTVVVMHALLHKVPEVQKWLNDCGISAEAADKLMLGAHPDVGWFERRDKSKYRSAAVYTPHCNFAGELIGLKMRAVPERGFLQWDGSDIDGLFAAHLLDLTAGEVLMLEGDKDVAIAMSHGFNATCILSSQSKLFDADITLLAKYPCIYLIGDQDPPGIEAMDRLAARLPRERVIRVSLPAKDIGELYNQHPDDFKQQLEAILSSSLVGDLG
jgi:hypothetical protein